MPTTFVKGDLFAAPDLHAFAHGCNAAGHMDAGVSVAFKKRWPAMFEEYERRCKDRRFQLGDVLVWSDGETTVYTLCTQQNWKTPSKLAALVRGLEKTLALAAHAGILRIGLPRIGAGVGGLDWGRVKKALTELGEPSAIELVVFEQFIRAKEAAAETAPALAPDASEEAPPKGR